MLLLLHQSALRYWEGVWLVLLFWWRRRKRQSSLGFIVWGRRRSEPRRRSVWWTTELLAWRTTGGWNQTGKSAEKSSFSQQQQSWFFCQLIRRQHEPSSSSSLVSVKLDVSQLNKLSSDAKKNTKWNKNTVKKKNLLNEILKKTLFCLTSVPYSSGLQPPARGPTAGHWTLTTGTHGHDMITHKKE